MSAVQNFNQNIFRWSQDSKRLMKNRILRLVLNIGHGYNDLSVSNTKYAGESNKISFIFPYYMVFVEKGAGRGYGGSKSGKFTNKLGGKTTTASTSIGRMGTGARQPKPWFNPVIEQQFPELMDIVATYRGEKILLNIKRILID